MREHSPTISVLLVDDHELVRKSLRSVLSRQTDFEIVGEAEDGFQALRLCEELEPNVIVLDMSMPKMGGVEVLQEVTGRPNAPKVIVCSFMESLEPEALKAGASAFIGKRLPVQALVTAIRSVSQASNPVSA